MYSKEEEKTYRKEKKRRNQKGKVVFIIKRYIGKRLFGKYKFSKRLLFLLFKKQKFIASSQQSKKTFFTSTQKHFY